jgi:hypothetical protein
MTNDGEGTGAPLDHTRQATIDALCDHFAQDAISVEDFEARVDVAHRAQTVDELRDLLRDLPSGNLPAVADSRRPPIRSTTPVPGRHPKESGYAVAVMGGTKRVGEWSPARVNHAVAVMGGAQLDFREAALPAGVTELKVYAVMGGVEIIVPPGLAVESHGLGIMGAFDHVDDDLHRREPGAPALRVSGVALMGGVEIKVRHPGETAREARRRHRQERRDRSRELRQKRRPDLLSDDGRSAG